MGYFLAPQEARTLNSVPDRSMSSAADKTDAIK
jgi:hypothetical protein